MLPELLKSDKNASKSADLREYWLNFALRTNLIVKRNE